MISTISDPPLPSPLFDSKPSGFCGYNGTYRGSGTLQFTVPFSDLRTLPLIRFPFTLSSYPIPSFLRTNLAVSVLLYPLLYSIPSPVISVVTMAVTEVPGIYFTLRFPLRFTVPFSPLSDFRTSPYLLQDQ